MVDDRIMGQFLHRLKSRVSLPDLYEINSAFLHFLAAPEWTRESLDAWKEVQKVISNGKK